MPEQEIVIVSTDGTEHVFPAGFDPKRAAAIVSKGATAASPTKSAPAAAPEHEPDTYAAGAWKGLKEGVAGGAKGFVEGMAGSPGALVSGVGHMLTTNPMTQIEEAAGAISRVPAAVRASATDPEGWGRDIGNLTGQTMLTAAGPKMARAAVDVAPKLPAMARAGAASAVKAGAAAGNFIEAHPSIGATAGAAVGYAKGGLIGAAEGALSGGAAVRGLRVLKTMQKLQEASGKTPPLTDIVEAVQKAPAEESVLPPGKSPVTGKSVQQTLNEEAIAARRALNAAAQTMSQQILAEQPDLVSKFARTMTQDEAGPIYRATDFTKPTKVKVPVSKIVATQDGFQNPIIEQYRLHPGSELPSAMKVGDEYILGDGHHRVLAQIANGATEVELNAHPVDAALRANPQPRAMWLDSGGKPVGGGHVPLSEAVTAVRDAAKAVKPKLTATEFTEATRLTKQGRPASDVMDAIDVQRRLKDTGTFGRLPTDTEMRADLGRRARSGQKTLMPEYGNEPQTAGNPFR